MTKMGVNAKQVTSQGGFLYAFLFLPAQFIQIRLLDEHQFIFMYFLYSAQCLNLEFNL